MVQNFVGIFPSDKMNNFLDFKKMMKGKKYPFLIANTVRSDKQGTHWWSILYNGGKKDFLLFDSFGIKGLKNFIVKDDEIIVAKVLKGIENLKEDKTQINLVNVTFVKNSYSKLSEGEKAALSETCTDFLHFLELFADHENQGLIYLWLLEDPMQDITTNTCEYFQTFFYENLFFPDNDSILHKSKRLTNDVIQSFFQELFTRNPEQNKKIIRYYVEQKNNITLLKKMVFLTVKSEFFNEFLDYLDINNSNYISFDLKEIGKVISFCIRLNYDLE